ncbi:hypothetical protein HMI56_004674 [Coelomomyces lativittatus]|nr:hypothetical protein HMI56_004674 [Coelomomyces lativittatus]
MVRFKVYFFLFLTLLMKSLYFLAAQTGTPIGPWLLPKDMNYRHLSDGTESWANPDIVVKKLPDLTVNIKTRNGEWNFYGNGKASVLTPHGHWYREESGVWYVDNYNGYKVNDMQPVPPPPKELFPNESLFSQYEKFEGKALQPTQLTTPTTVQSAELLKPVQNVPLQPLEASIPQSSSLQDLGPNTPTLGASSQIAGVQNSLNLLSNDIELVSFQNNSSSLSKSMRILEFNILLSIMFFFLFFFV